MANLYMTIGLIGCPTQASELFVQLLLKGLTSFSLGNRQFLIAPRVGETLKGNRRIYVPSVSVLDSDALGMCSGILLVTEGASVDQQLHTVRAKLSKTQTMAVLELSGSKSDFSNPVHDMCQHAGVQHTTISDFDPTSAAAALILFVNTIAEKLQLQDDFFQRASKPTIIPALSNMYEPIQTMGTISVVHRQDQNSPDHRDQEWTDLITWPRIFCKCGAW